METLIPTWDLFILILFLVIIAYSFMIGRASTSKIVIATYIAILAADGLGNYLYTLIIGPDPSLKLFSVQATPTSILILKLGIMALAIVMLVIKGGFEVSVPDAVGGFLNMLSSLVLGFLSAGLIVGAILVYISGGSFLPGVGFEASVLSQSIIETSQFAKIIWENSSIIFALPALGFILMGMFAE